MSDALKQSLITEIDKHLPGMVGEALKQRLEQADRDASKAKLADEARAEAEKQRTRADELSRNAANVTGREKAASQREEDIRLREAVLTVKEECNKEKAAYMQETLRNIFRDRSVQWTAHGSLPSMNGMQGYLNVDGMPQDSKP